MTRTPRDVRRGEGPASLRGAVTAEFAVAIPAVILLLGLLLSAVSAGVAQIRVEEAARSAARTLARGDDPDAVAQEVRRIAGGEAEHAVEPGAGTVTVRVSSAVPGPVAAAAGLRVAASATLALEGPR